MHPLDEKYWSKREYWNPCYNCPADPRILVSKHPRWAGYTVNFAHKRAIPILAIIYTLASLLPIAVFILLPANKLLLIIVCLVVVPALFAHAYRVANPKTWKEQESANQQVERTG